MFPAGSGRAPVAARRNDARQARAKELIA